MAKISQDIMINDGAFILATQNVEALQTRIETFKETLENLYDKMVSSLDTPAGVAFDTISKDVIMEPILNMEIIVGRISELIDTIRDEDYYRDVFIKFEELNDSIKYNF